MAPIKKFLMLTNSKLRQANTIFLATSHVLLELGAEVHFASFPPTESRISEDIKFHLIDVIDVKTAYPRHEVVNLGLKGKTPIFYDMHRVLQICPHTTMP